MPGKPQDPNFPQSLWEGHSQETPSRGFSPDRGGKGPTRSHTARLGPHPHPPTVPLGALSHCTRPMLSLPLSMQCNLGMPAHATASALMSSFQKKDAWLPMNLIVKPLDFGPLCADFNAHRPPCWCGPLLVAPAPPFLLSQDHWPVSCPTIMPLAPRHSALAVSPSFQITGPSGPTDLLFQPLGSHLGHMGSSSNPPCLHSTAHCVSRLLFTVLLLLFGHYLVSPL